MFKYFTKKYWFCNRLYTTNKNKKYIIIKNIISKTLAKQIILEAEEYAKKNHGKKLDMNIILQLIMNLINIGKIIVSLSILFKEKFIKKLYIYIM